MEAVKAFFKYPTRLLVHSDRLKSLGRQIVAIDAVPLLSKILSE